MNPSEIIKDKLRIKQNVDEFKSIPITIPIATGIEKVKLGKITMIDEREKDTEFDIKDLVKRLEENE